MTSSSQISHQRNLSFTLAFDSDEDRWYSVPAPSDSVSLKSVRSTVDHPQPSSDAEEAVQLASVRTQPRTTEPATSLSSGFTTPTTTRSQRIRPQNVDTPIFLVDQPQRLLNKHDLCTSRMYQINCYFTTLASVRRRVTDVRRKPPKTPCAMSLFVPTDILLLLFGLLLVAMAIFCLFYGNLFGELKTFSDRTQYDNRNIQQAVIMLWVLIGIGVGIILIASFGLCGSFCRSFMLLSLLFVAVLMTGIVLIVTGIAILTMVNGIKWNVQKLLERTFGEDPTLLRNLERTFECCGISGYQFINCDPRFYGIGCVGRLESLVQSGSVTLSCVTFGGAVLCLALLFFTCILWNAWRQANE